jgi:glycosyltransferase involved in cell wall biosynthesis
MKVLFISRSTLFSVRGGDTIQIEKTAKYLGKLGIQVDIRLSGERINYSSYDLLHFFNIIRPADILYHASACKKPFVISTIYCDYDEYDSKVRGGMVGLLRKVFSADALEYLKVVARRMKNGEKIRSLAYLIIGHKRSVQKLIASADLLLPNSENEIRRLAEHYGRTAPYKVIPNGVDDEWLSLALQQEQKREGVLCVAQIEGRKNQLNLIRAMKGLPYKLSILGKNPPNFDWYMKACKKEAGENVHFLSRVSEEELIRLYRAHKVHALPSWFETTGLVSLEAALMGCSLVISNRGDTTDYFGEEAAYCEPDDVRSIRAAIEKVYESEPSTALLEKVKTEYTWSKAAEKTLEAYKEVLARK